MPLSATWRMGRPPARRDESEDLPFVNFDQMLPGQKLRIDGIPVFPRRQHNSYMRRLLLFFGIMYSAAISSLAQVNESDTVVNLEMVTVTSARDPWSSTGLIRQRIDPARASEDPAGSLADLLTGSTSVMVNNYGQGTLATLRIRGTSANHTGILWNGIRLAPPNIGYLDLSLIDPVYFRDVSVLYGGSSPAFGGGFIGGSIHLDNPPVFRDEHRRAVFSAYGGSFGLAGGKATLELGGKKIYSNTALAGNFQKNDFPYDNLQGQRVRMEHAGISRFGGIQGLAVRLRGDQFLQGIAWFQYADRDIPPTLTEAGSEANQVDRSARALIVWKKNIPGIGFEARGGYFNEFTRYEDPPGEVYSVIKSQTWNMMGGTDVKVNASGGIFAGATVTCDQADLTAYDGSARETRTAAFASFHQKFTRVMWDLTLNIRQEYIDDHWAPFLFSVGMEGAIAGQLKGHFNISRNFRSPTLNEKYWQPGGNPDLEPEMSWNQEAGLSVRASPDRWKTEGRINCFSSFVDEWIQWVPRGAIWGVENRQEVWSRGIELAAIQLIALGRVQFSIEGSYTLSKATNEKKNDDMDAAYKKQLIYTPEHRAVIRLEAGWKGYSLVSRNTFTGQVYTTTDNSQYLPGHYLSDLVLKKELPLKESRKITVLFGMHNLFGNEYEIVPFRPMPGFSCDLTVQFEMASPLTH